MKMKFFWIPKPLDCGSLLPLSHPQPAAEPDGQQAGLD
jgi:hypothetical protein